MTAHSTATTAPKQRGFLMALSGGGVADPPAAGHSPNTTLAPALTSPQTACRPYLFKSAMLIDLLPGFSLGVWGCLQEKVLE